MKTLFVFQIQSFTDVVTNSSSELFVFTGTTEVVSDILDSNVPGWEHEYDDPQSVQDLSPSSLKTYLSYAYDNHDWNWDNKRITRETSRQTRWAREFNIDPNDLYENYKEWDPNSEKWEISQLQLKEGWDKLIKQKLNPNLVFVFSKGENPNWEADKVKRKRPIDFLKVIDNCKTYPLVKWLKRNQMHEDCCGLAKVNDSENLYALWYDDIKEMSKTKDLSNPRYKDWKDFGYKGVCNDVELLLSEIPEWQIPMCRCNLYYNRNGWENIVKTIIPTKLGWKKEIHKDM